MIIFSVTYKKFKPNNWTKKNVNTLFIQNTLKHQSEGEMLLSKGEVLHFQGEVLLTLGRTVTNQGRTVTMEARISVKRAKCY